MAKAEVTAVRVAPKTAPTHSSACGPQADVTWAWKMSASRGEADMMPTGRHFSSWPYSEMASLCSITSSAQARTSGPFLEASESRTIKP
jgi:hypothetical protein